MKRNKWGIAAAAVGIHICVGSVYAWSVLTRPLQAQMGVDLAAVQWAFSIAIFFLGMSAAFFGGFVEGQGPKIAALVSAACFCTGLLGTGLAVHMKSIWLLYASYGVLGGIGLGIGYIAPVSTLVKWFPKNRGFATGLAIMGFGFASFLAGPLMQWIGVKIGFDYMFGVMALSYFIVMTLSALYLKPPADKDEFIATGKSVSSTVQAVRQWSAKEALGSWRFYSIWWMIFINITCGIGLLSVASPMAQELVDMTATEAAVMVGIVGLVNGAGRLGWASVSDYLGRPNTYLLFFILQVGALYALAESTSAFMFQLFLFLIISCYGGGFATLPAFLADLFGTKALSNIHGKILTAWAMAGIAGPLLISYLKTATSGYTATLYAYIACLLSALVVGLIVRFKKD